MSGSGVSNVVPRISAQSLTVGEFYDRFMIPNRPVIITGVLADSKAAKDWIDASGAINAEFFSERFGETEITVHNCSRKVMGRMKTKSMTIADYMQTWNCKQKQKEQSNLFYLKDWCFCATIGDYEPYVCPEYFREDWLNSYERNNEESNDHRFVYMGPADTFTPLHKDVLQSFSWSVNLRGRKEWVLFPPSTEECFFNSEGKQLFDIKCVDHERFPRYKEASEQMYHVEQGVCEAIFVPSGWWHQVHNLQDTLSINHNWLNGANIHWSWKLLSEEAEKIKATVPGCDEDDESAQELLEFKYEWNYESFHVFLCQMLVEQIAAADEQVEKVQEHVEVGAVEQRQRRAVADATAIASKGSRLRLLALSLARLAELLPAVAATEAVQLWAAKKAYAAIEGGEEAVDEGAADEGAADEGANTSGTSGTQSPFPSCYGRLAQVQAQVQTALQVLVGRGSGEAGESQSQQYQKRRRTGRGVGV
jgi:hypothetical protein